MNRSEYIANISLAPRKASPSDTLQADALAAYRARRAAAPLKSWRELAVMVAAIAGMFASVVAVAG